MPMARGHASSSTLAYGCGFIIIGGALNGGVMTADISYYDIDTDTWTKIGDLPKEKNTPVCVIYPDWNGGDDWLHCESPKTFSARIQITL